tara:strand:- start:210 stop:440 length:231 start_codon:yes stop_codon:yes gene_type:complete
MNEESTIIAEKISEQWREIYKYEKIIINLKKEIKKNRKKLFNTCAHKWEFDSAEPFDSRCKYKCKFCNLPKNSSYI